MTITEIRTESLPPLALSPETAFPIVIKARELGEKVPATDPDSGSNPGDDLEVDVLEDSADDTVREELAALVNSLNDDEQLDLISLIWLGRGDFALSDWDEARLAAADIGRERISRYVAEMPLVSDHLQEALSQFGQSLGDYLDRH